MLPEAFLRDDKNSFSTVEKNEKITRSFVIWVIHLKNKLTIVKVIGTSYGKPVSSTAAWRSVNFVCRTARACGSALKRSSGGGGGGGGGWQVEVMRCCPKVYSSPSPSSLFLKAHGEDQISMRRLSLSPSLLSLSPLLAKYSARAQLDR